MADQHHHHPADAQHPGVQHYGTDHAGPDFHGYMKVFYALCVLTLASFVCNELARRGIITTTMSVTLIVLVAVVKALFVVSIFMHLKWDWGKVYCIMIPVCILAVMMIIVLLPDMVLGWNRDFPDCGLKTPAAEVKDKD